MTFSVVLICSIAVVLVSKPLIKKYAIAFYALALLFDVLFIVDRWMPLPALLGDFIYICIQRCTLSLALFVLVMYVGIFKKDSRIRNYLMPIRKELSIEACFLAIGHMVNYLFAYAARAITNFAGLQLNIATSLVVSLILFALLIVLGITSFDFVKKHMSTKNWKNLQKLSYLFFMLVYVHVLLFLLPSAMQGGSTAQISVVVYSVIFIFYASAKIVLVLRSPKDQKGQLEAAAR